MFAVDLVLVAALTVVSAVMAWVLHAGFWHVAGMLCAIVIVLASVVMIALASWAPSWASSSMNLVIRHNR
jgi:hypothetical protein